MGLRHPNVIIAIRQLLLSEAEAIVLRSTLAQPTSGDSREERSEIFLNLQSIQRIEVLHSTSPRR